MWQGYGSNAFPPAPAAGFGIMDALNSPAGGMRSNTGGAFGAQGRVGGSGGIFGSGSFNLDNMLGLLGTGFGIYNAFQANKLAKKQFNFTKDITNTNLNNQMQSYNTALEDRIRARTAMEGRDASEADAYLDQHRLTR